MDERKASLQREHKRKGEREKYVTKAKGKEKMECIKEGGGGEGEGEGGGEEGEGEGGREGEAWQ